MSTIKKLMMSAAGGAGLNVEDVFSTYVYKGTGSTDQTIANGIDLANEGGLVWMKIRNLQGDHNLYDTERGRSSALRTNYNQPEYAVPSGSGLDTFNEDGFTLGENYNGTNQNNDDIVSWTFRKAPKFFDVVTWTGTGSSAFINHNLGSVPGTILVKCTSTTSDWFVHHRSLGTNGSRPNYLKLNTTSSVTSGGSTIFWTPPTDTYFGAGGALSSSGETYVAYLFAHNDGDGEFGPNGDQDIIKCGSYESDSTISLGFEPQWILLKSADNTSNWAIHDAMRGLAVGQDGPELYPNLSNSEGSGSLFSYITVNADGFSVSGGYNNTNLYIAIRRGPMGVPESGTDFFGLTSGNGVSDPYFNSDWPVDFALKRNTGGDNWVTASRLCGSTWLRTNDNNNENNDSNIKWDYNNGWWEGYVGSTIKSWMWRRAPSCFDVVTYRGTNGTTTINHNLGVVPEMMWFKTRNDFDSWVVYHKDAGNTGGFTLNSFGGFLPSSGYFNNTSPTDSVFTVSTDLNFNSIEYVAYLFASLNGVSKVGSYTGNGSSQTIDCGFSSGARFVLIKRTAPSGNWYVWDTQRGIVSANDPHLALNLSDGQVTTNDSIDPVSSGFAVNQVSATDINLSSTEYIFYAIA